MEHLIAQLKYLPLKHPVKKTGILKEIARTKIT
jgi:hypothetical protein